MEKYSIFGLNFQLSMPNGEQKYKSFFGGLLTFLTIALTIGSAFIFLKPMYSKIPLNVISNTKILKENLVLNFKGDVNGDYTIVAFDGKRYLKAEEMASYFVSKAVASIMIKDKKTGKFKEETMTFDLKPCREVLEEYGQEQDANAFYLGNGANLVDHALCRDLSKEIELFFSRFGYVKGSLYEEEFHSLKGYFFPCKQGTNCKGLEELKNLRINIGQAVVEIDYQNFERPLTFGREIIRDIFIHPYKTTIDHYFFRKHLIYDNSKSFSKKKLKFKTQESSVIRTMYAMREGSITCTAAEIEDFSCQPYARFVIRADNTERETERVYENSYDVVSKIGGFAQIFLFIFGSFGICYNLREKRSYMRERIFGEEHQSVMRALENVNRSWIDFGCYASDHGRKGNLGKLKNLEFLGICDFLDVEHFGIFLVKLDFLGNFFVDEQFDELIDLVAYKKYLNSENRNRTRLSLELALNKYKGKIYRQNEKFKAIFKDHFFEQISGRRRKLGFRKHQRFLRIPIASKITSCSLPRK